VQFASGFQSFTKKEAKIARRALQKKLRASQDISQKVIVRGQEDEGVQLWGYSQTTYNKFLDWVNDPRCW
jgi:hypothetical protein